MNDKRNQPEPRHENPLPGEISPGQQKINKQAHDEAEKDIQNDAETSAWSPNDDLDEGESARLGEDTDVV